MNKKILLVAIGFVMFCGLFYWFQIRPAVAKHACYQFVATKAKGMSLSNSDAETMYSFCLHNKGL
jgi:hypothetical protein